MSRTAPLLAFALLGQGCIIYSDDVDPVPQPVPEYAPFIYAADAGCTWDGVYGDFIWWFQAEVYDDNGFADVAEVWADVYDARGGFVQSFQLFRETPDPAIWFSDWLQYSTALDCYYGGYQIDVVAFDRVGYSDAVLVYPATWY